MILETEIKGLVGGDVRNGELSSLVFIHVFLSTIASNLTLAVLDPH